MNHSELSTRLHDLMNREDNDIGFVRLGVGVFAFTLAYFLALTTRYARKAAAQTWKLSKTLFVLVCVYAVYYGMTQIFATAIGRTINYGIKRLTDRGTISERVGNVIGAAVILVALFAFYRVLKWGLKPITDAVPNPSQTTFTDYLADEYAEETEDDNQDPFDVDPEPGTFQHQVVHGPDNSDTEVDEL